MTTLADSANALPGTEPTPAGRTSRWPRQEAVGLGRPVVAPDVDGNPETGHLRPRAERVVGLKKWEGQILEISDGMLAIELTPSDHDGPELVADFDVGLLGPDSSSAEPGDIIYLTTRTIRDANGYPYQTSSLKLRRPGAWTEDELDEIRSIAKRQAELFKELN